VLLDTQSRQPRKRRVPRGRLDQEEEDPAMLVVSAVPVVPALPTVPAVAEAATAAKKKGPAKKKAKKAKACSCGSCGFECETDCICCDKCEVWSHNKCAGLGAEYKNEAAYDCW
jgi:hypothetical protein